MTGFWQVLDPRAQGRDPTAKPLPVIESLAGGTVAFLNNSWTSMDRLAAHFGELLQARYGVARVMNVAVPPSSAADSATLDRVAGEADCAVVGLAN